MTAIKSYLYGILAAAAALIAETTLSIVFPGYFSLEIISASFISLIALAAIEEIVILIMIRKSWIENDKSPSIFSWSLISGLGFSSFELLLRLSPETISDILRPSYLGIFFIHILTAGFYGFMLSRNRSSWTWTILLIIIGTFTHFLYNYLIIIFS
jgi:hypothetical protein